MAHSPGKDSQVIEWLRFPLTFLVVMQHCRGDISLSTCWQDVSLQDFYYAVKILFSGGLSLVAVPAFFFISGYLFFRKVGIFDLSVYKQKLKKRARSLVVPYLLWNLLCIPLTCLVLYFEHHGPEGAQYVTGYLGQIRWVHILWDHSTTAYSYPNILGWYGVYIAPLLGTMWFVRDLIVMSVLSPLVYWFVRKTGFGGMVSLTILYLFRVWPPMTVSNISVLFFTLGAYFSICRGDLSLPTVVRTGAPAATLLLIVAFVLTGGNDQNIGWQLTPLLTVTGVLSVLAVASWATDRWSQFRFPALLSDSSFFVYALHLEFALPIGFFIAKAVTLHSGNPIVLTARYLLTPILIYAICLAVYASCKKVIPRVLSLLTGNR